MPTDPLDAILTDAGIADGLLRRDELELVARRVTTGPPDEFIDAVTLAPGLSWDDGQPRPRNYFEIHGRQWWIDVNDDDNRQHLLAAVVAAALVDALKLHLSTRWVTQVVSSVVAVRSVAVDDAGLHLVLGRLTRPELVPELADTVNPDDFMDFVKTVIGVSEILPLATGGTMRFTAE